jgi:hypothetical protein
MSLVGGDEVGIVLPDPHPVPQPVHVGLRHPLGRVTPQLHLYTRFGYKAFQTTVRTGTEK